MAFNIIISEDPDYTRNILNSATRLKISIKVISKRSRKISLEIDKSFSSLNSLNENLRNIDPYESESVFIFLELSATVGKRTYEFVQIGEGLPLTSQAYNNGFITDTYHGTSAFPYFGGDTEIEPIILEGDLLLQLIEKSTFETILQDDYSSPLPSINLQEAQVRIDQLTSQYTQILATLNLYKKETSAYVNFKDFTMATEQFYNDYYDNLMQVAKTINDITSKILQTDSIDLKVESNISARYKAMVSAKIQIEKLCTLLDDQGFGDIKAEEKFC